MSPIRTGEALAFHAVANLRSLATGPVDTAGVAMAGTVAILGWAFGAANVALLWIVGLTMLLDLMVGAMRAVVDPLAAFDVRKLYGGLLGKLFRAMLIPAASLVDWLYITSPLPLPHGYDAAFPVTAFVMVGLAAAEITSTLNKFSDSDVAPGVIAVIIRQLDRIRTGSEPPIRRHYDAPAIVVEHERENPGQEE